MKLNLRQLILLVILSLSVVSISAKDYKGAELYSYESVLYGRFEIKIKAATGKGILSTFFLYKNDSETNKELWEEIDIEIFGKDTNSFQTNIITEEIEGKLNHSEVVHRPNANLAKAYHIYAIEWTPAYIAWYFDDIEVRRDSAKYNNQVALCDEPMSMRFNTWASTSVPWVGAFDVSVLPQVQYVDYLKFYEYTPNASTVFTHKWTDEFDSYNSTRWGKANWTFDGNYVDFDPANVQFNNSNLNLLLTSTISSSEDHMLSQLLEIFPSPVKDILYVTSDKNIKLGKISIYNLMGHKLLESDDSHINTRHLHSGIYVIQVQVGDKRAVKRFVKE